MKRLIDLRHDVKNVQDTVLGGLNADIVPIQCRGTLNRLRALEEDGELESKQIGGRNTVWWFVGGERITPDERDVEEDAEKARDVRDRRREDTPTRSTEVPESDTVDSPDALTVAVEDVAEGWENTNERLEARKAAARALLEYAREHGTVSKQEAKEKVYPEYPIEGQNVRTWYRKNIRPVLKEGTEYDQSARAYRLDLEEL